MKVVVAFLIVLGLAALGLAQVYKPAAGETALKVSVEGRGDFYIRLYTKEAPKTTAHIMALARQGFYNGQRFFRVTRTPRPYIAQVGDPASKNGVDDPTIGSGGSGARIPYEDTGKSNEKYAVGLATLLSNDRNSGDSQFYIVLGEGNGFLDGNYTVFGKVVAGTDVVDRLEKGDRITSVTVL